MSCHQKDRLIRLHKQAKWHSNEYKRLLGDPGAQSKAHRHLQTAEQLHAQISCLIRYFTSTPADLAGILPDSGFLACQRQRTDS
jgi:hypothetical protein